MIMHHPSFEGLFDYATGSLSEPVALAMATHAALCGECRKILHRLDVIGGAALHALGAEEVSEGALEQVLARLDQEPPAVSPAVLDAETRAQLPRTLWPYVARSLSDLAWHRVGRLFEEVRLPLSVKGYKASLMRLRPGVRMPTHSHRGNEFTVVLAGGYSDDNGRYDRGDFDVRGPSDRHQPVVDDDEECLCLVVLDAPVKLTGPFGHLVNPFLRV